MKNKPLVDSVRRYARKGCCLHSLPNLHGPRSVIVTARGLVRNCTPPGKRTGSRNRVGGTRGVITTGTHLDPDFRQIDLHGQLLAAVHVRVMGLLERSLQLVQLIGGERGAVPAVLLLVGRRHATGRGRGRRARPAAGHVLVVRIPVAAVTAATAAAIVHVA